MSIQGQTAVAAPKITIVTVVYNDVKHIEATIESVINQTYEEFEYIVVDGASQDGTVDIVKKYQEHFVWTSEPDQGIYDAMNKGVGMANGTWVLFMNSGDVFVDNTVLVDLMSHGVTEDDDFVYGDFVIDYGNFQKKGKTGKLSHLWKTMPFTHQSLLAKVSLLKTTPFDTQFRFSADHDFIYRSYLNGHRFKHVPVTVSSRSTGGVAEIQRVELVRERRSMVKKNGGNAFQLAYFSYRVLVESFKLIVKKLLPDSMVDRIRKSVR